jgi:hypothetical protein
MERADVARLLNVAEADITDFVAGEHLRVSLSNGAERLVTDDGVFALNDHSANRQLRRWTEPVHDEPPSIDDEVPEGSADVVLTWVGEDPERALKAWETEQARPKPRSTLLAQLEKLVSS